MTQKKVPPKTEQKPSQRRGEEIRACMVRADLRPVEAHNTGFSLEHHYQATLAAPKPRTKFMSVPIARPTVIKATPK